MQQKSKMLASLMFVVFVDSVGWGIAFSVFAALFLNSKVTILPVTVSVSSRYMWYECLLAVYSFFMFFFAPILGGIADRYGRKPALKISMSGLTVGFMLNALGCYCSSIWLLILGRIIAGATAGSVSVAQAATVDLSTPQQKSFYLSVLMTTNTLGFSLGPVLGSLFMLVGWLPVGTTTFLIAAVMSALSLVSILYYFKETFIPQKKQGLNALNDFSNIWRAFCNPTLNHYLSTMLVAMIAFSLFFSNIPVFLNRRFTTHSSNTGLILTIEAIVFSIALMFGGKYLFNRFKKTHVVALAQILQLIFYLILTIGSYSFTLNVILFTGISVFTGLMYIALLTLISDSVEQDWQGRVMGVVAALSSVIWGIGPLLTGTLNHYSVSTVFMCSTLLLIVALIFSLKKITSETQGPLLVIIDDQFGF